MIGGGQLETLIIVIILFVREPVIHIPPMLAKHINKTAAVHRSLHLSLHLRCVRPWSLKFPGTSSRQVQQPALDLPQHQR